MSKRIAVIGGGISGLTTAFLLKKKGLDVTLFEASPEVGGNIRSELKDGYLLEHGPNSLLRSPRLVDLIDALGLRSELFPTSAAAKKRFVLIGGELKAMPAGFGSFLFGGYFSLATKLRLLREPFVSTRSAADESVADFFERRLGSEIVRKAADPFISGIFAGDPKKLSIAHAFPQLLEYERDHGSLIRGALRNKNEKADAGFPRSFTFRNGLRTLPETLQAQLAESVRVNTALEKIERADAGFGVSTGETSEIFAAVVISTRADVAAEIISDFDPHLAAKLRDVYYPPITVVRSGYARLAVKRPAEGFGFLVPRTENRKILGSLWTSSVFPDRAPDGMCLFTSFVGGARSPELCELSDDQTTDLVHSELADILDIAERPRFQSLTRWNKAIPQYNIGYEDTVGAIENFTGTNPGAFVCSNFYRGISVGDCVKNAYRTADEIEAFIKNT